MTDIPDSLSREKVEQLILHNLGDDVYLSNVIDPYVTIVESRPFEECPHCSSYDYRLIYRNYSHEKVENTTDTLWWVCERCELRRAPDDPGDGVPAINLTWEA